MHDQYLSQINYESHDHRNSKSNKVNYENTNPNRYGRQPSIDPDQDSISLLDFICNGSYVKNGPPTKNPKSDTLYGPWISNNIAYLSVYSNNRWRHIKLADNYSELASGVYGSKSEIPIINVDGNGNITSITTIKAEAELGDSGVSAGSYGSVNNGTISVPSISVNSKGVVTEASEQEIALVSQTYTHYQDTASNVWVINHNLGKFPSITTLDSAGSNVLGDILYNSNNTLTLTFSASFSGISYLN